jgi:hypothetical protein
MHKTLATTITLGALGLGLLSGCGDSDSEGSEEGAAVTPRQAVGEIGQVRHGLAAGLAAYVQGDAERAERLVGDAYLEHFELVEGPLETRNEELNEELEELIREELRDAIRKDEPVAEVRALVGEANDGLDRATRELGFGK